MTAPRLLLAVALVACSSNDKGRSVSPAPPTKASAAEGPAATRDARAAPKPTEAQAPAPAEQGPKKVTFLTESGEVDVAVELAVTPRDRTRGLMFRERLDPGVGMFFVFPEARTLSFWMKNTLIPLDMIFIGPDLRVVCVVENAEPRTLSGRSCGPGSMSKYVLEVPGGWAAPQGIASGVEVKLGGGVPADVKF